MFNLMANTMNSIASYFDHPFLKIIGGITTIVVILAGCYTVFMTVKGIFPVLYRLGVGLSKRRIAIFAGMEFHNLRDMLVDSKLFEGRNILQIHKTGLDKAGNETVFLVHWKEYQDKVTDILALKKDSTALIVYAPQSEGRIEPDSMEAISSRRNTIVVNFRGRLLNDILVCLMTTGYEKRK
jgi:hypothetical protein